MQYNLIHFLSIKPFFVLFFIELTDLSVIPSYQFPGNQSDFFVTDLLSADNLRTVEALVNDHGFFFGDDLSFSLHNQQDVQSAVLY